MPAASTSMIAPLPARALPGRRTRRAQICDIPPPRDNRRVAAYGLRPRQALPQRSGRMHADKVFMPEPNRRIVTRAKASPRANMAVVLVLGANPRDRLPAMGRAKRTVAARASVLVSRAGDRDDRHPEPLERWQ